LKKYRRLLEYLTEGLAVEVIGAARAIARIWRRPWN
jgi:hypothetical protein